MKYIKVEWIHDLEDEPIWWYHEIGEDGYEVRKILIYRDGVVELVSETVQTGDIDLSDQPFLAIEEINEDPEFVGTEISREEFEDIWNEHI